MQFINYNFGHDEWDYSTEMFRKWKLAKNPNAYRRMPTVWGSNSCFLQNFEGKQNDAAQSSFVTASIKFRTSKTFLQNLFPNEKFSFQAPGTVAYASLSSTTLYNIAWLGGTGYDSLGLHIHGVQYQANDGTVYKGAYMPVLFENLADTIISGREDFGLPKLFAGLKTYRTGSSYSMKASWRDSPFCNVSLEGLEPFNSNSSNGTEAPEEQGIFVYKYIPAVGKPGQADIEYPVMLPKSKTKLEKVYKAERASFTIDSKSWEALPTLHHIVSRMAEMPVYEVLEGTIMEGTRAEEQSAVQRLD
jgi:hypothetical protein